MRSFLILLVVGFTQCTKIKFMNKCGHEVRVMRQEKGHDREEQAMLNPGEEEMSEDFKEHEMAFMDGEDGMNTAEFHFNGWNSMDLYNLRITNGFTTPMMVQSNEVGGYPVNCRDRRCFEAYLHPTDALKTHGVRHGGMFTLTFCP